VYGGSPIPFANVIPDVVCGKARGLESGHRARSALISAQLRHRCELARAATGAECVGPVTLAGAMRMGPVSTRLVRQCQASSDVHEW
jgi:hypothetical protein